MAIAGTEVPIGNSGRFQGDWLLKEKKRLALQKDTSIRFFRITCVNPKEAYTRIFLAGFGQNVWTGRKA